MKNRRMHFGKRLFALILVCIMATGVALASENGALPQAAIKAEELLKFRTYYTYMDSGVGEDSFSVVSEYEAFAKKQAESKTASALHRSGLVILSMRVDINLADATVIPFLRIQYQYKKASNMHSATIQVENEQYDFPLYSIAKDVSSSLAWQEYLVPLNETGLGMIGKLLSAPEFQFILHGDNVYRTTIKAQSKAVSTRDRLESSAYQSIGQVYHDLLGMGMLNYQIWTRNLQAIHTFFPEYREDMWNAAEIPSGSDLPSAFGTMTTLGLGDKGEAVRTLEGKLIELGFLNGTAQRNYNEGTYTAVKWAQEYYHLPATGCADLILLSQLYGLHKEDKASAVPLETSERVTVAQSMNASEDVVYRLSDVNITMMDYWCASEFFPSHAETGAVIRSTGDEDLCFLIIRGRIENLGEKEWTPDSISGYVLVNGRVRYHCLFEVEADGGRSWGNRVLPLGETEILACAAIPRVLMEQKNDSDFEMIVEKDTLLLTYSLE